MASYSYDVASNYWQALMEGGARVVQNVAPLGGGVYLLGEKASLQTGGQAGSHPSCPVRGSST